MDLIKNWKLHLLAVLISVELILNATNINFAVFNYEILGETAEAYELANRAYNEAGAGINQLSPESKEEATHTLELLKENIQLWQ